MAAKKQDLVDLVKLSRELSDNLKSAADNASTLHSELGAANKSGGGGGNPGGGPGATVATPKGTGYTSGSPSLGSQVLGGLGNFAMTLPAIMAQALPSPAAAASYQLATARTGFFSGMSFGQTGNLQRQVSMGGTALSSTDAVDALGALQGGGIYNLNGVGRGVAALSNYAPNLGLAGTATAAASLQQGRSVNMLNQIGVQVRGANGLMRDPNQIANDLVDKIWSSTPPLQQGGAEAMAYLYGSLQPGNQLYLILNTYISDPNLQDIVRTKLFAKAKGLPANANKQQLTQAGITTAVTTKMSGYNTSQLNLTQATQGAINQGTATALGQLTSATNAFAEAATHLQSLLKVYGYTETMLGGANGAVGQFVGSLLGNVLSPVIGAIGGKMLKGVEGPLSKSLGTFAKALGMIGTAVYAGMSGYSAGKKGQGFSWGSMLKDAAIGFVVSGFDPLGAVAGAGAYAGGYAVGNMNNSNSGGSGGGVGGASAAVSLNVGNASPQAGAALMTAASQIGTPYSWGGGGIGGPTTGLNQGAGTVGFDCSSLVQYVFAKQGINLPRTTYDQVKCGMPVQPQNAQAGDLLFFGNPQAPDHVGIYAGNGKMIQAPHTGGSVEVVGVDLRGVAACRRVLGSGGGKGINWSTLLGGMSGSAGLVSGGMGGSVNGYDSASNSMASGGVVGVAGTTVGSNPIGTTVGGSSGAGGTANITINVTVPSTTSPHAAAATTKAVKDGVAAGLSSSQSRSN